MHLSKPNLELLRQRLSVIEGGIKRACELGGITEQVANKMLKGGNCRAETITAFVAGIERAEKQDAEFQQNIQKRLSQPVAA
jgi:hypothetical protein